MAENPKISQIKLPNGSTYDIEDIIARQIELSATYTETSIGSRVGDLALIFETIEGSDKGGDLNGKYKCY